LVRISVLVASLIILSLVVLPSTKVFAASYQGTWTITSQTDPQKQPFAGILVKYAAQNTAAGTLTLGVDVSLTYVNDATAHLDWIEFYDAAVHLRNTANGTDVAVSSTDSSHTRVNAGGQYTHSFSVSASQPGQYFVALTWKTSTPMAAAYGLTVSATELSWDTGNDPNLIPKVNLTVISTSTATTGEQPPAGVCLSPSGTPSTTCPPYVQVVSVDMAVSSGSYVGTINLAGIIPFSLADPNCLLEWDFLIDADRNSLTNSGGPWTSLPSSFPQTLFENDIGADYIAGLEQHGTAYRGVNASWSVPVNLSGFLATQSVRLIFAPSSIGGAANFDFVVTVREYAKAGNPNSLMVFDKAPNVGHYSFVGGVLTSTSKLTSASTSASASTTSKLTSTTSSSESASTSEPTSSMMALAYVIIALPFIGIIGLIVFVVRRRRRKGKRTGGTAAEGLASRPSPAPVPTAEGTKFCTACGVRIPVTAPFCVSCGGKQD